MVPKALRAPIQILERIRKKGKHLMGKRKIKKAASTSVLAAS
jgi:hypothetical protein